MSLEILNVTSKLYKNNKSKTSKSIIIIDFKSAYTNVNLDMLFAKFDNK